ncbi:iron donor protein CyaY [Pasteurellaceae bacterium Pebbles2]|nr:iron donor protein CyaY [Pasteurellaceae bacterium Pebbles2]
MNLVEFHQNIEQIWDNIEEQCDEQGADMDFERQGAVFTITCGNRSQIVINKQEAMLELWLASRLGGLHFRFENGEWVNHEGKRFWDCLGEACVAHGEEVSFA